MKDRRNSMYKYAISLYKKDGMFNYAQYRNNLYDILRIYMHEIHTTCNPRPTLWIYDGKQYVRIHDFMFKELTPETYELYLEERILESDKLLEGVDECIN